MSENAQSAAPPAVEAAPQGAALEGPLSFGDLARLGKSAWWRYMLAVVGVFGLGIALAFSLVLLCRALHWQEPLAFLRDPARFPEASLLTRLGAFAFVMATVIAFLPPARFLLPLLFRRPWRSFLTARARFSLGALAASFSVMVALLFAAFAVEHALSPETIRFSFDPRAFAAFAALSLFVVPLQSLTEELLFRGWLLQAVGRLTSNFALRAIVPALVFTLAHLANPELSYGALLAAANYALAGLYLSLLALRGQGLELPLGVHLATNIFVILVSRPAISAVQTPALFVEQEPALAFSLFGTAFLFALHYFVIMKVMPQRPAATSGR
jgi:hypothetical protein